MEATIEPPEISDYEKDRGKPMPNITHSIVQTRLAIKLSVHAEDRFLIASELTIELPDGAVYTPDISILPKRAIDWRREPVRCQEVPLSVVEIYSPTQGYQNVMTKLDAYFAHGVLTAWVVEPATQLIALYLPGQDQPAVFQTGEVRDPATGLAVRVEEIFA